MCHSLLSVRTEFPLGENRVIPKREMTLQSQSVPEVELSDCALYCSSAPRTSGPILGGFASSQTLRPDFRSASEQVGPMEAT